MVDVLFNCLLKNKEIAEELAGCAPGGGVSERMSEMPDGEDAWKSFYEHPLTAATTAMLNIGGSGSEEQNPAAMGLLYEYYKLPLDKVDKALVDKYGSIPELWTTAMTSAATNGQSGGAGSLSVSLLPQTAGGILKGIRRISDTNDVPPQDMDIYLNRGLLKRESPSAAELLASSAAGVITSPKPTDLLTSPKPNSPKVMNGNAEDPAVSPLPVITQVKQEPSPGLPPSPTVSPDPKPRELPPASTVIAQAYSTHVLSQGYESLAQYTTTTAAPPQYQNTQQPATSVYMVATPPEYRDYYPEQFRQTLAAVAANPAYTDTADAASFVDRYIRQAAYKGGIHSLTVDLPSPDSGIGETTITPREAAGLPQVGEIFDYSELSQTQSLLQNDTSGATPNSRPASSQSGSSRKSWHEYGRNSEADKVQIPKLHSDVGFRYFLESPISTSQRREDDRITYINKGQFYGITLEYIPDSSRPLKSTTVKTMVMLMFREEKPSEEELKAWQFWHSRQHSVKQRILDADTKNSNGIIGQIEEITHNAIAFYWNPLESPAKVNIAVQCLSTDFSNQKGVKGLPLHVQIDTFDDFREHAAPYHRGYCQIKVFCDKGAERKTRDEERRAAKRKLTASANSADGFAAGGRKKLEEMYHPPCDRSEFYSMSDLLKPPILFVPNDDIDKVSSMELSFYTSHPSSVAEEHSSSGMDRRDTDSRSSSSDNTLTPPPKRIKIYPSDRVLLYARQDSEEIFHALHLVPPTLAGLAKAIESRYKISATNIRNLYKRCKKGITVQMDDDVIKHYCNEDTCIIELTKSEEDLFDITLVEL